MRLSVLSFALSICILGSSSSALASTMTVQPDLLMALALTSCDDDEEPCDSDSDESEEDEQSEESSEGETDEESEEPEEEEAEESEESA